MTDQHRATPEQWSLVASEAFDRSATHSCIIELRDTIRALCKARNDLVVCSTEQNQRIEALEADQLEQAESGRFCTDAIVRRVEALELAHRIQSGTLTSAERAELGVVPVANLEAAVHRAAAEARDAVMVTLSHLSDAEREQMAQELAKPAAWRPLEVETTYGSEAAAATAQQILRSPVVVVEGTFVHGGETYRYKANATPERTAPTPEPSPASTEAQPAGGVVEKVARVIDGDLYGVEARAAIREVAAAARLRDLNGQSVAVMTWEGVAQWLEQEANQ
jgi:hypothetical protein